MCKQFYLQPHICIAFRTHHCDVYHPKHVTYTLPMLHTNSCAAFHYSSTCVLGGILPLWSIHSNIFNYQRIAATCVTSLPPSLLYSLLNRPHTCWTHCLEMHLRYDAARATASHLLYDGALLWQCIHMPVPGVSVTSNFWSAMTPSGPPILAANLNVKLPSSIARTAV